MFITRQQPWQLGFTDVEMEIFIKVFQLETMDQDAITDDDELTDFELQRAQKMLATLKTQYEAKRIKRGPEHDPRNKPSHHETRRPTSGKYRVPDEPASQPVASAPAKAGVKRRRAVKNR